MRFDRIAVLDWSAARGPKTGRDSIWLGVTGAGGTVARNLPTRAAAAQALADLAAQPGRLLIGADFAFGYPRGFAAAVTGQARALAVWDWLAGRVHDAPGNVSNYRQVAAQINALFPGDGPFWGNGQAADVPGLPRRKPALPPELAEHRAAEDAARAPGARPKAGWQLAGAGAVGAQALTGLPVLARLRVALGARAAVWPFEDVGGAEVVLAEVYPALIADRVRAAGGVPDEAQVRLLSQALWGLMQAGGLPALFDAPAEAEEGWILGAGHGPALSAILEADAPPLTPPRLRNDCFAMPQGVDWVPVDEAQALLRTALAPLTGEEVVPLGAALGRVLARDALALRDNPPVANAAVDGYGFAHAATGAGVQRLPLCPGRAAAGGAFGGVVPEGQALRILTGAVLPKGVDTVVLEEDCATDGRFVAFDGPVKRGMNTRKAGEDVAAGTVQVPAARRLRAPDLAFLAATGHAHVWARRRLRVAVLSTGDEIVAPGGPASADRTYDANRPMLLALVRGWGHDAVDLGHAPDDAGRIAAALDRGARRADVILTSGGASAGDEDHVSRLLRTRGNLSSWRVAMKPGRPLALAIWRGVPVFGLPGNPVAAMVCALVFGRPALSMLSGAGWQEAEGFAVPAAFSKAKKAGRREYLRARLDAKGRAEVFASEGSGRIGGLAWATGLVELPDEAMTVAPGDMVRFLPYAGFGV